MKTVIILGDGMSDRPVPALCGMTPLMAANKPYIDRIAREGRVGLFRTIQPGQPKGSAVANLAVLGYDPAEVYQGRAVLEAASMGVSLDASDVAFRCNLVCLDGGRIKNHSAGHISSREGAELIRALDDSIGGGRSDRSLTFQPGVSYRHLLVLKGAWASPEVRCAPPHDHVGEKAEALLPEAVSASGISTAARLIELYRAALPVLAAHPVNIHRLEEGKDAANAIWCWSPGRRPEMRTFQERFGVRAAVISAVSPVMNLKKRLACSFSWLAVSSKILAI